MSTSASVDTPSVSRVGKSVTLASMAVVVPRLRTTDAGAESDAPVSKRKAPRSFSLTPEGQRKGVIDSRRSKEAPEVIQSDFERSESISPRRDSSSKHLSATDHRKVQNSKRRSAPNPKHRLKFDKGSPVVKAGSMEDLVAWLIDCAGCVFRHENLLLEPKDTSFFSEFSLSPPDNALLFCTEISRSSSDMFCIEYTDKELMLSFLIGYTSFWKAEQLFKYITDTFRKSRNDLSPQGSRDVFSTLDFINLWIDSYWVRDFERQPKVAAMLGSFLEELNDSGLTDFANRLKLLIVKRVGQSYVTQTVQVWASKNRSAHAASQGSGSTKSKKSKERASVSETGVVTLAELTAAEFAEQLTVFEYDMFCDIEERELLNKVWLPPPRSGSASLNRGSSNGYQSSTERLERVSKSPRGNSVAPQSPRSPRKDFGLLALIDHFNKVSLWVATEIVCTSDIRERANLIKKFISVAERLAELNNFNGLMEVISGMNMTAVQRLQRTWMLVPGASRASFERMSILVSTKHNFQNYRSALASAKLPALPYIGVYLRDLVFIEEANPGRLESGLINFDKIHLEGKLVLEVRRFQRERYLIIKPAPNVHEYLKSLSPISDDDLFSQSLKIEPDDALAQALQIPVQSSSTPSPRESSSS